MSTVIFSMANSGRKMWL